jgi:hypothetical protein
MLAFPTMTAPAFLSLVTIVASFCGRNLNTADPGRRHIARVDLILDEHGNAVQGTHCS